MPPVKVAIPLALVCLALGLGAGIVVSRERARSPAAAAEAHRNDARAAASTGSSDDRLARVESELAALRAEVERLRGSPARASVAGGSPDPVQAGAESVASLRSRVPELLKTRDGQELLRVVKELTKLGEPGCAEAAEIAQALWKAVYEDGETGWGIDEEGLERSLFCGPMLPLMLWTLSHPDRVGEDFRHQTAWFLEDVPGVDPAFVREMILVEREPGIASAMAGFLVREETPEGIRDLVVAARARAGSPEVLEKVMENFWNLKTPEALRAVEELAGSSDPELSRHARQARTAIDPPAGTAFVTHAWMNDGKGLPELKRGDLVLSVEGLADLAQLREHLQRVKPEEWIVARIRRNGEDMTIQVPGRAVGIHVRLPGQ